MYTSQSNRHWLALALLACFLLAGEIEWRAQTSCAGSRVDVFAGRSDGFDDGTAYAPAYMGAPARAFGVANPEKNRN
jgi:hypothetical protein